MLYSFLSSVPIFLVVVGAMLGYILWQRIRLDKLINMDDWNIPIEDIIFFYDEKVGIWRGDRGVACQADGFVLYRNSSSKSER